MPFTYRADHVGSLLRPQELLDARAGNATSEQLTALEDKHILRVLQRQKDLGFKIFTDGEFRRQGFMSDFYDSVEGLDRAGEVARQWKGASVAIGGTSGKGTGGAVGAVVGKIRQIEIAKERLGAPPALGQRNTLDLDAEHDVLGDGAPRQQQILLQHEGDVGVRPGDSFAVDEGLGA